MKTYILNTLPFVFAFIVVTGVIIYLNGQFNNIFQFDFTPKNQVYSEQKDSTQLEQTKEIKASDKRVEAKNDSSLISEFSTDSIVNANLSEEKIIPETDIKSEIKEISKKELEKQLDKKPEPELNKIEPKFASNQTNQSNEPQQQKQDSSYSNWLKKVSKLLEQMEPSKASKIIQNYSDNVARDIIYTMNKKSAAKIVSELSPEIAQRIIRYD
ncbi:MAG: magnesium transporter MgtE N-terminal domain-containing protein [Ignavibacterium sp.]